MQPSHKGTIRILCRSLVVVVVEVVGKLSGLTPAELFALAALKSPIDRGD
jgi:hypothetical protein